MLHVSSDNQLFVYAKTAVHVISCNVISAVKLCVMLFCEFYEPMRIPWIDFSFKLLVCFYLLNKEPILGRFKPSDEQNAAAG